jgi:ATP-binding cassette subfamily B protein
MKRRPWHYVGGIISVIILDAIDIAPALIVKHITNEVQHRPAELDVVKFALFLVAAYFGISILRLTWRFCLMLPSRTLEKELRDEAYQKLLHANYNQVAQLKIGDVISTLSQDVSNIRMFMGPGVLIFFDSLAYVFFIPATLFYILGTAAFYVLAPFVLLALVVYRVQKPIEEGYQDISHQLGDLSQYIYEDAAGSRFFRAEGLLEIRRHRYQLLLSKLLGRQLGITKWELGLDATLQSVIQTSYLTVLILAFMGHGEMSQGLGVLTVSIQLLDKLLWPLMSFSYLMNLFQQAKAGSYRFQDITSLSQKSTGNIALDGMVNRIVVQNLSARSLEGKTLLSQVNFEANKGEHIALIGKVGSGKSLMLQILAGMWEIDFLSFTELSFNGHSFHQLKRQSLWNQLSYMPQTPQIFNRTLAGNISPIQFLKPQEIHVSLERADLSQDVAGFEQGLNTLIGEKGMNLSGGQKSRTLIARSFHAQAGLYLWDDSMSALDSVTERKILENLRQLHHDAILISATHRLSSLKYFDRIAIFHEGSIVAFGQFSEIKGHPVYLEMESLQQERDAWT